MSEHGHHPAELPASDTRPLADRAWPIYRNAFLAGAVGLVIALLAAFFTTRGWSRFGHAYIAAFAFFLSIALGCMCFVLATHVCKAGWSVLVRRPAEVLSAIMPTLGILFVPVLLLLVMNDGSVFPWADSSLPLGHHGSAEHHEIPGEPAAGDEHAHQGQMQIITVADDTTTDADAAEVHGDESSAQGDEGETAASAAGMSEAQYSEFLHLVELKASWLNIPFFIVRWIFYLLSWSFVGLMIWRWSVQQDKSGDVQLTRWLETASAPALVLVGLTLTFASFDLMMSLDPMWFSTIFGVYYFAGGFLGAMAMLILVFLGLQRVGLAQSVNVEHYHDLGKLLFAFVFFWGYIAFSQYMLIWYAEIPGELTWPNTHGLSTVGTNPWTWWALALLFGHLLIPFAGLLSRHAKRNPRILAFWAIWLLVFHWADVYWLVMPEFSSSTIWPSIGAFIVDLGCLVGVGGIVIGAAVKLAAHHSLIPTRDPRLGESISFHQSF